MREALVGVTMLSPDTRGPVGEMRATVVVAGRVQNGEGAVRQGRETE